MERKWEFFIALQHANANGVVEVFMKVAPKIFPLQERLSDMVGVGPSIFTYKPCRMPF